MRLVDVADTSAAVTATAGRSGKIRLLASCLRRAADDEVEVVASYLSGELRQRRTGLGYAALRTMPPPAHDSHLDVLQVDAEFALISTMAGAGSTTRRRERLTALLAAATASEQRLIAGLITGELRQGALDGVLTDAVALASELPATDFRRAVTVAGALIPVAAAVLTEGEAGLARFRLTVGAPVRPMLAAPSSDLAEALARTGEAAVEWKLDGVRVQVHRSGDDVAVFTRTLDDITSQVPEIVEAVLDLSVRSVVLDGETIALALDGRPLPFQRTASRVSRRSNVVGARHDVPLSTFFFDCLYLDGNDLIGAPAHERWSALATIVPAAQRVPRVVTSNADTAHEFYERTLAHGHEGVVVKSLDALYQAGRRGSGWLKVKPRHTLDLVILAAEWGHGRRQGWLSNLHLGARDPNGGYGPPGGFVMLGKTFKGLTDAMLAWQTHALLPLADGPNDQWVVKVRPELVVEIAFDGVQTSPRYPAGVALRFARVLRHRDDKSAADADSIDAILRIHDPTRATPPEP